MSSDPYSAAESRMDGRGRTSGGGGSGQDFLTLAKPSSIGQTTQREVRILQRLVCDANGRPTQPLTAESEFWKIVDQHGCPGSMIGQPDKRWVSWTCPDTELHDHDDWRKRMTCPICILQNAVWEEHNPAFEKIVKLLRWKTRVFANVIDMGDIQSHWKQVEIEGQSQWVVKPKIWGFSKKIFGGLIAYCRNLGPIEDWQNGRSILVEIKKTGPNDIDVEYAMTPLNPATVDQQLMPVVIAAGDLNFLAGPASMSDLQDAANRLDPRSGTPRSAGSPVGQSYAGSNAPPTQAAQPPPPTPSQPMGATGMLYQYSGASGQAENMTARDVASRIVADPQGEHYVWAPGWPNWSDAKGCADVAQIVSQMSRPQTPPQAPAGPPGMPSSVAPPNPPAAGGSRGYAPQGGYPVGGGGPPQAQGGPPSAPTGPGGGGYPPAGPPMPPGGRSF